MRKVSKCWLSARPEVRGTADTDGGTCSPSGQSFSYSLTTLSSSSLRTDGRWWTWMVKRRGRWLRTIFMPLRWRECCMLGASSSQPTVPLHKLPPARLVTHQQTSAHEQRKGTREGSVEVGHLSVFLPPASLAVDNGRAPRHRRAPRGG